MKDLKEIEEYKLKDEWNPVLAVPLVSAELKMVDFLNSEDLDSVVMVHSDNFISLIYKSGMFHAKASDYISVPWQTYTAGPFKKQVVGADSILVPIDLSFSNSVEHEFNFNTEEVSTLITKEGLFKINFISTFNKSGYARIEIPAMTKNGISFVDTLFFSADTSYGFNINQNIDISGYTFDLTNQGTGYNTLSVSYEVFLEASNTYVRKTDNARFELVLRDIAFEYVEGYLGAHTFEYRNDSTDIDLFKNSEAGRIHFENPQLKLHIYNSFGIPVRLINPQITAISEKYGNGDLNALVLNDPLVINYPSIAEKGSTKYTGAYMNKTNSNISEIINKTPKHIVYNFDLDANYGGKTHSNFAYDTSEVKVEFETILPLYGRTDNWVVEAEHEYSFFDMGPVEAVQFKLYAKNWFPVEAKLQVYFMDSNNVVLDSLIQSDRYLVSPGLTDINERVVTPTEKTSIIEFDNEQVGHLEGLKKLKVRAEMSTTNEGTENVKIFSDYTFEFNLSTKVRLDASEITK